MCSWNAAVVATRAIDHHLVVIPIAHIIAIIIQIVAAIARLSS